MNRSVPMRDKISLGTLVSCAVLASPSWATAQPAPASEPDTQEAAASDEPAKPKADARPEPSAPPGAQPAPEEPSTPDAAAPDQQKLEQAKQLFYQGNALRKAGDYQRALERYQRSRALVVSVPNTLNAAYCLEQLGRAAEALEYHEELLTVLGGQLSESDRAAIADSMTKLRPKVGSIDVSASVAGLLVVDGRMRGNLPLMAPVRVMPGRHVLRVIKDGYETFETEVTVRAAQSVSVDARLKRLTRAGRLRVDVPSLKGAELFVDGARVAELPWEGTLAPGRHVYWVTKGDVGTAPQVTHLLEGQTVTVRPTPGALSGELRIVANPPSAEITLDGVLVGKRSWYGRLPTGSHVIEAHEEGYRPARLTRSLDAGSSGDITLDLAVDEAHPRWKVVRPASFFIEGFGGMALAPSLGSGAESFCDSGECSQDGMALGWLAGALAGYEFPFRLSLEASAGYLWLGKGVTRSATETSGSGATQTDVRYELEDEIRMRGPFVSIGTGYRHALGASISVGGSLHFGAVLARTRDRITANASTLGTTSEAFVERSGEETTSVAPFILPTAEARWKRGAWHLGLGVSVPIFVVAGPDNDHGELGVPPCDPAVPVTCVKRQSTVKEERAYGAFWMLAPRVSAGVTW